MPLPINTTLSLLGASRPGDALPSKLKKAMLVRMSSEILDALEATAQPLVQFEFGENPGLYIGDTCFSMVHSQEIAMHELYLRAASATKKNAPLKLYANVVGKFTVEQREIGNELRDKIRESTQDAAAQKSSRATVFMDTPPETQTVNNKKRKDAPMFHKPLRQSDKVKSVPPTPATSIPSRKVTPTHQLSANHQGGVPVRKRLVHCLARGEKSEEELFKLLGADRNVSLRAEIAGLLDQLTELKTDKSGKVYRLKPTGWKEVRPFEWPGLSEQERVQLARIGRLTLKSLRIPESDPLWTHFKYKNPPTAALASNPASSTDAPRSLTAPSEDKPRPSATEARKRGVSSRELKEKKTKPKANPKAEIQMKDESQRALKRPPADSVSEGRRTTVDSPWDTSTRTQPPSSARQAKPSVRREIEREPIPSSVAIPKSSTSHREKPKPQELKRLRENDVHDSDSEKGRVKVKERLPRKELQDEASSKLAKKKLAEEAAEDRPIRKWLDEDHSNSRGSLKRKASDDPDGINAKRRAVEEESSTNARKPSKLKTRDDDEYTSSKSKASSKRKAEQVDDDNYEPVRQKKPRPDRDSISSTFSSSRDERQRKEHVATKKPGTEARIDDGIIPRGEKVAHLSTSKIKKVSPPPTKPDLTPGGRETDQRRSSTLTGTSNNKHPKPRRIDRSSVYYTSTEEEKDEDFTQSSVKDLATPVTNKVTTTNKARNQPLPPGDNPRARYATTYVEYLEVMRELLVQKGRLTSLLESHDFDSSGTISDSEGDLLPAEELGVVSAKYKSAHNELLVLKGIIESRVVGPSSDSSIRE